MKVICMSIKQKFENLRLLMIYLFTILVYEVHYNDFTCNEINKTSLNDKICVWFFQLIMV